MDFSFSEEQEILKRSARDFLVKESPLSLVRQMAKDEKGFPPKMWKDMADLGWLGLVIPEEYGGAGGSFLDLAVLMEEMGRACMPAPFYSHAVSTLLVLEAASKSQKKRLLPPMAGGETIVTLALSEDGMSYEPSAIKAEAVPKAAGYAISGKKIFVPAAHASDRFLVVARTRGKGENGLTIFDVDAKSKGIRLKSLETVSGEKQYEVSFKNVLVASKQVLGTEGKAWRYLVAVMKKAAVAKCAEMVGAAQYILDMTVNYAKERVQFDQPIGKFQAIQHHCANMAVEVNATTLLTHQAAWMLGQGLPCDKQVAMAKGWASDSYRKILGLGHQVHGGVAIVDDHDLTLFTRRSIGWEAAFGDADYYRELVAQEMGM